MQRLNGSLSLCTLGVLASCLGPALAQDASAPSEADLARSFAELRPHVEEALGRAFEEPPRFVHATTEELHASLVADWERLLPPDKAQLAKQQAAGMWLTAKAEGSTGKVLLDLAAWSQLKWSTPAVSGRCLDLLLVHEAVHMLQQQQLDTDAFMKRRAAQATTWTAASVVLAVHAQWVTRQVARATGREDDYASFESTLAGPRHVVGQLPPAAGYQRRIRTLSYRDGLVFLAKVGEVVGGEAEAVKLMFESPPNDLQELAEPGRYLTRLGRLHDWAPQTAALREAAHFGAEVKRPPLTEDTIQALLKHLPPEEQVEAATLLLRGEMSVAQGKGWFSMLLVVECRSEEGAERLVELHAAAQVKRAEAGNMTPERIDSDGGVEVRMQLPDGQQVGMIAFRVGRLYLALVRLSTPPGELSAFRAGTQERIRGDAGFAPLTAQRKQASRGE